MTEFILGHQFEHKNVTKNQKTEKPGLVDSDEGSRPRGRGFESCHILDGCKRC